MLMSSTCIYIFLEMAHYPDKNRVLNFFLEFNWIVINVFIAYAGSIVTIAFYAPAASPLPFDIFDQLADGMLSGKLKGLYLYDITKENVFMQARNSKRGDILARFNEAYKVSFYLLEPDVSYFF